jgi:outer membrane protein OmpA-like peptidoglycan-associated protein
MRSLVIALATLALTGCAHTGVSLFDGEKSAEGVQNPTGALAVLDPVTGKDISVVDQSGTSRSVRRSRVSIKNLTPAQLNSRYGSLLSSLPEPPRLISLYFKSGTTELVDESILPALFAEVKRRPGVDVQIVGHTDTTGSGELNDKVSLKRAEQVRDYLQTLGLQGDIVSVAGRGERELKVPTADEVDEGQNRRVDVYIK